MRDLRLLRSLLPGSCNPLPDVRRRPRGDRGPHHLRRLRGGRRMTVAFPPPSSQLPDQCPSTRRSLARILRSCPRRVAHRQSNRHSRSLPCSLLAAAHRRWPTSERRRASQRAVATIGRRRALHIPLTQAPAVPVPGTRVPILLSAPWSYALAIGWCVRVGLSTHAHTTGAAMKYPTHPTRRLRRTRWQ